MVLLLWGTHMSMRIAAYGDLPQMLEIYSPYVLKTAVSFEYTVPTIEEFTHRFQTITNQFLWLYGRKTGRFLGYAYGSAPFERAAYAWCAEASIYLHPQIQEQGIGKLLYRALEAILTMQGYRKQYAVVTTQNTASVVFRQGVGYTLLATFPDCGIKFGQFWASSGWNRT